MYKTISPVISQKQSQQAQLLASKLNDSKSRKQANIDFLGCLYLIDYFQSIGIRVNSQRSIFRCSKLYKDFEAVDIYCNSHMLYVVTSYGTDYVKIPAMHRQFEMLPEAYVVVDLKIGMREAEIKGFITPADFDYAQTDGKYYKFDINKLTPFDNLLEPLRKYTGIKSSVGKHLDCMKLFVPYIDNKLSDEDKKKLINHILTCETCKKRLIDSIEFDNNAGNLDKYPSVVSKNDLTSKAAFKARLMKSAAKENEQVLIFFQFCRQSNQGAAVLPLPLADVRNLHHKTPFILHQRDCQPVTAVARREDAFILPRQFPSLLRRRKPQLVRQCQFSHGQRHFFKIPYHALFRKTFLVLSHKPIISCQAAPLCRCLPNGEQPAVLHRPVQRCHSRNPLLLLQHRLAPRHLLPFRHPPHIRLPIIPVNNHPTDPTAKIIQVSNVNFSHNCLFYQLIAQNSPFKSLICIN